MSTRADLKIRQTFERPIIPCWPVFPPVGASLVHIPLFLSEPCRLGWLGRVQFRGICFAFNELARVHVLRTVTEVQDARLSLTKACSQGYALVDERAVQKEQTSAGTTSE